MAWNGIPVEIYTAKNKVTIRAADGQDLVTLMALRKRALLDHPTSFGANGLQSEAKYLEWTEGLISADVEFKQAHSAVINAIYLQPEWRGYGLVQALLKVMEGWASSMGVVVIKLQVTTVNLAASRAYEKAGYKIYATDPMVLFLDGVYLDEYLMMKVLD